MSKRQFDFFLSDCYNYIKNLYLEVPAFEANVHLNSIQIKYIFNRETLSRSTEKVFLMMWIVEFVEWYWSN